nr:DOG1 domain-containing protein [Tanacetum cinerariifolium]
MAHYIDYYLAKAQISSQNVFLVLSPPWFSSYERTFLWVAGFKPGLAIYVAKSCGVQLNTDQSVIGILTTSQSVRFLAGIAQLQLRIRSDHTEETRSGCTTDHANNSHPEYDSFCFEIEPDQGRDIHFLEELLGNDSIPLLENESSNFDHHDDPSFPLPPPEPPDVKFFFDFEPNSEELISAVINNTDELNEDECFDPGGDFDVFANIEDGDYFPFISVIRIFLPYLIYPEVSPLLFSVRSEDTIFNPDISI